MIRYAVSRADLEKAIQAESKDWLSRARDRTEKFRGLGHYVEDSPMWSEVKAAYMRLQGNSKCAYCERKLESIPVGKVEQDVEHFRPKASVKRWSGAGKLPGIRFAAAPATKKGYYLLPYHPLNYAAACKPCNSTLKKDYFPIAGAHQFDAEDPARLKAEKPYLPYPISNIDDDPEKLIAFAGISPRPVAQSGYKRNRALVTIAFFRLDDGEGRKNLLRERALLIVALYPQLDKSVNAASAAERKSARDNVKGFQQPHIAHTNCARSFVRLFKADLAEASAYHDGALKFVLSIS